MFTLRPIQAWGVFQTNGCMKAFSCASVDTEADTVCVQKGFEIEEPDFPQHKQRKVQSATVVGEQAGTQPDSQSDESDHVIDFRPENGDELNYEPSSTKGKNKKKRHPDAFLSSHKVQQKRKLLGLDKDGAGGVKAKPSTSISKDVLKMFAT